MAMNEIDDTRHQLERLGSRVAAKQESIIRARVGISTMDMLGAIHRRIPMQRPKRRWIGVCFRFALAILSVSVLAGVFVLWVKQGQRPLEFEVAGRRGNMEEPITAPNAQPAKLTFDDGSVIVLYEGGRARVVSTDMHGARILLEEGTAGVHVIPRSGNQWSFVGGPFEVAVLGTQFDVSWNPHEQSFGVELREGHVRIRSDCMVAERDLHAPASFHGSCSSPGATNGPPTPPISPPEQTPVEVVHPEERQRPSVTSIPVRIAAWRIALMDGESRMAAEQAQSVGISQLAAEASSTELLDLASAARLAGASSFATTLYNTVRSRHFGTTSAAIAAFHLGRMAFDGRGAWNDAASWFAIYLREQPGGSLAAEALGRSIECADRMGATEKARGLSQRYLERFPNGAHAPIARRWAAEDNDAGLPMDTADSGAPSQ